MNIAPVAIIVYLISSTRALVKNPTPFVKPPAPKCRDCIFFDNTPVYTNNFLISEGRCLKTAKSVWKIVDKIPTKLTRYDYVESTRINGICGPEGLLFCHKNILNSTNIK